MAFDFRGSITFMEEYGFYDVVLPFLLVFTLVFATLQKIKIFGKESRRYNAIIALVMALMFIAATKLVEALNEYLPIIALVLALFLGLMLILGIFGVKEGTGTQKLGFVIAGGVAIAIGISYLPDLLGGVGGFFDSIKEYSTMIIIGAILLGIIFWVVKGEGKKKSAPIQPLQ